jgi:hypothetical protein
MNKTTLIAAVALTGAALVAGYLKIHTNIIANLYPDLDPKIAKKAHSMMVKRALAGNYTELDGSDETYARIFEAIVKEITSK